MRKIALAVLMAASLVSCNNSSELKVDATIDGLENDRFIVSKIENNRPEAIDTVDVVAGKFIYTEALAEPDFRLFVLESNSRKGIFVYVGNDNVTLTANIDSLDKPEIKGSEYNEKYFELIEKFKAISDEKRALYQEAQMAQMQKDSIKLESLKDAIDQNDKNSHNMIIDFTKANTDATLSAWALNTIIQKFEYEEINPIYLSFTEEVKASKYGTQLAERLEKLAKLAVGAVAPDFTLTTTDEVEYVLSAQKGKYVLIDFWAHWCTPCRQENPNNVKLMEEYAADGFTIAGISIDRPTDKDKWLNAIVEDNINYTQMLDTKEVNKVYDVRFIPATFLVDMEGKILAKNLRGEELAAKLKEIFGH